MWEKVGKSGETLFLFITFVLYLARLLNLAAKGVIKPF
jgi:hypothetical protein